MRLVVKVGTSTLTHATGNLNIRHVEELCKTLSDIKNAGHEIIIVSSGAIGMGVGKLSLKERPSDIPTKQAAAAVGQCELMYTYDKLFGEYNHTVAQILLTGDDFNHSDRLLNFTNTVSRLLELGALPIINENDSISASELNIKFGDNDVLSSLVATLVKADTLVILSTASGLLDLTGSGEMLKRVEKIDAKIKAMASGTTSATAVGGMITKLEAATIAKEHGIPTVIINGRRPEILYDLFENRAVCTVFGADENDIITI